MRIYTPHVKDMKLGTFFHLMLDVLKYYCTVMTSKS